MLVSSYAYTWETYTTSGTSFGIQFAEQALCVIVYSILQSERSRRLLKPATLRFARDTLRLNGRVITAAGTFRDTLPATPTSCEIYLTLNVTSADLRVSFGADVTIERGDSVTLTPSVSTVKRCGYYLATCFASALQIVFDADCCA